MAPAGGSSALAPAETPRDRPPAPDVRSYQTDSSPSLSEHADVAVGVALAAGLTLVTFIAGVGDALGSNTWVQLVLIVIGVALCLAVLTVGAPAPRWGVTSLVLFAAVAAFTALSIAWSVQPDNSWLEANRTLSYLAVFAGAMALARLFPERWAGVAGAVALFSTAIGLYALIVKVFPETFDAHGTIGRIYLPIGYWNATGLIGALGVPACLWAGARRERARAMRALAVPAVAVLVTVAILSYSRSALCALIVGLACWFAFVPLRLRGALVLGLGLVGAAALSGWALATHGLSDSNVAPAARSSAGHGFGILLVCILVALGVAGLLAAYAMDRAVLAAAVRKRIATGLLMLVALVPLAGIVAVAASSRGLTGEISHAWHSLTEQKYSLADTKSRIGNLESSRPRDWSEGLKVGEHALLDGVGAAGYGTARTRYAKDVFVVQHAHSYVIETFADFGLIGLALNLALLVAWGIAAARTVGVRPREVPPARVPERAALLTLLCVVIVFGADSAIDWTWFVPATTVLALLCAGWLAGRGPLAEPVGRLAQRRRLTARPALGAAVIAIVALALLAAWTVVQPLRASDAYNAAYSALARGDTRSAFADARTAAARDPLSVQPLWALSDAYSAIGDERSAREQLVKAARLQPQNPNTWLALGTYDLQRARPALARADFGRALTLDLNSSAAIAGIAQASAREQAAASK
ncbi:MAG TPA: O-antigen ligase family protein [Solirubrobacteraceae bacterium]|nr:O-antigen ligase family protein [Solirubrobacteraceae bacterium]